MFSWKIIFCTCISDSPVFLVKKESGSASSSMYTSNWGIVVLFKKYFPVEMWSLVLYLSLFIHCTQRRQWHPTPVLLPGKSHGRRSLVGYSPWGGEESDTTEQLHFHFSLSCIGEGNATHSSVLAWRIPETGEPGGLPSMGSYRVGRDWSELAEHTLYKYQ